MKLKKIYRPEIEVEYVGVKGDIATYKRYRAWLIPKYKLKKVRKLSESEVSE